MAKRKPTMKEVKTAIDNIIIHMSNMQREMTRLDSAVASYVEYKGDSKKWPKWLEKKMEKLNVSTGKDTSKSEAGNNKTAGREG